MFGFLGFFVSFRMAASDGGCSMHRPLALHSGLGVNIQGLEAEIVKFRLGVKVGNCQH